MTVVAVPARCLGVVQYYVRLYDGGRWGWAYVGADADLYFGGYAESRRHAERIVADKEAVSLARAHQAHAQGTASGYCSRCEERVQAVPQTA